MVEGNSSVELAYTGERVSEIVESFLVGKGGIFNLGLVVVTQAKVDGKEGYENEQNDREDTISC